MFCTLIITNLTYYEILLSFSLTRGLLWGDWVKGVMVGQLELVEGHEQAVDVAVVLGVL